MEKKVVAAQPQPTPKNATFRVLVGRTSHRINSMFRAAFSRFWVGSEFRYQIDSRIFLTSSDYRYQSVRDENSCIV